MSYYIHNVQGRLRIKSPAIKRNKNAMVILKNTLSTLNGIESVDINPTTGSIVVNYNPTSIQKTHIVNILEKNGYFDQSKAITNDEYLHRAASRAGMLIGKSLLSTFAGIALKETPLSFLTLLI